MVWLEFMKNITQTFWGGYGFAILFSLAIIAILFLIRDKRGKYMLAWYSLLILFFVYNPVTLFVSRKIFEETTFQQYYLRFYSLIPVAVIIALGGTLVINKFQGAKKLLATAVLGLLIVLLGNCLYNESWFTKAENRNKVPQDVVTICDIFADYEGDHIHIMAPQGVAVYLRQMDSRFWMPYARNLPDEAYELTNPKPNPAIVAQYCKDNEVEYVVVSAADTILNTYLNYGFKLYGRTPYYAILTPNYGNWVLTEYTDQSDLQGLCYTMYNREDGTLIVVDGGHSQNVAQLREAIQFYGGKVDAWIVTHYHKDHVDAFNEIYADPQGIEIKQVYASPFFADSFYPVAQEWDDVESFDKFFEVTKDATNINYVKRDDVLTFSDDLTITFYNSFDDVVVECAEDMPNNCSLVFKMATPNRSILMCSDCHSKFMAEYLVKTYGTELKSDILQCGHHGNNSMPTETGFYEIVDPEVAIFDGPDWLMTSPQYTAGALAGYLSDAGSRLVWYNTAPNIFVF